MPILVLVLDDQGNVVRVERRLEQSFVEKAKHTYFANEATTRATTYHVVADQSAIQLNETFHAIKESPRLTEQQRQEALALYNLTLPGDSIVAVHQSVFFGSGSDQPARPKPLIFVFVDP